MSQNSLTAKLFEIFSAFFKQKFQHAYYNTKESLGQHKRDLVVQHVEQACTSLERSRDQFEDTLDKFKTVICVPETSLEQKYKLLKRQYDFCQLRADEIGQKIAAISSVSEALFIEWEAELKLYQNKTLRSRSSQQLKASRQHYARLIKSLSKAQGKIPPVLAAFRDHVLFLKHNLNAQAIAALQHEFVSISLDISQLIEVMEKTISEANQFVAVLSEQKELAKLPTP
jgi:hypothetical protein